MDDSNEPSSDWLEQRDPQGSFRYGFQVRSRLFAGKSIHQTVEVVETIACGRALVNDGVVMLTERDEYIYHEMLVHVPMLLHPDPQRVLVVGGGDGGAVREILKHASVRRCDVVEIDALVVDACREYLPFTASALDDPRVHLALADGSKFIAEGDETYDVVLVDAPDPRGAAVPLFGPAFYRDVERRLTRDGIVVVQAESPYVERDVHFGLLRTLASLFPVASAYQYPSLAFAPGPWAFVLGSKRLHPVRDLSASRAEAITFERRHYNLDVHRAAFATPEWMRDTASPRSVAGPPERPSNRVVDDDAHDARSVRAAISAIVGGDACRLTSSARLYLDLGVDSVMLMDIVLELEARLGISIDEDDVKPDITVGQLVALAAEKRRAGAAGELA